MEIVSPAAQVLERPLITQDEAEDAVRTLLLFLGETPSRDGLKDTPRRVVSALAEMTWYTGKSPEDELSTTFQETSDELILLRDISFTSLCEHHLLPFEGVATVGYLPGRVVGISKLARLVDSCARRLQVQERMTTQIAKAIENKLDARGVGVLIRARHQCMRCRGVKQASSEMITSAMFGRLRESPAARQEFLTLATTTMHSV